MDKVYWRPNEWKNIEERRYGLYDSDAYDWITPCVYSDFLDIIDGATTALLDGKFGFIDASGTLAIATAWELALDEHGRAKIVMFAEKELLAQRIHPQALLMDGRPLMPTDRIERPMAMGISPHQLEEMRDKGAWTEKYGENGSALRRGERGRHKGMWAAAVQKGGK